MCPGRSAAAPRRCRADAPRRLEPTANGVGQQRNHVRQGGGPCGAVASDRQNAVAQVDGVGVARVFDADHLIPMILHLRDFQMRRPRTLRCDHVENIADRLRVASGFAEILPRLPRTFLTFLISAGTSADTFEYFGGQLALVEMQCFADWRIRHQRCSCRFTDCCAADDCVADSRPATSCAIIAVKSSCCPSCDCLRNAATSITCASA